MKFEIIILQAVSFMDLFAVGLIVPLMPTYVRQLGANHIFVGLMGSVYAGFQLGSGPVIGSLSDLKGRKNILIMTTLLCSVAYMLIGLTDSIFLILIMRAVLGLFKQTQMLARALVSDYEKNENRQSDIYGKMAAISGAGITTGPIIGGHIIEDYPKLGFTFVALLVGLCFIINAGLVYLLPKTASKKKKAKNKNTEAINVFSSISNSLKESVLELYKIEWGKYWDVFLLKGLIGFAMGVYYSNYALYLKTYFHLSAKYVGYVISFQGVIGSLSSYFIGYINYFYREDKSYGQRNFHVFSMISVSLCGLIFSTNIYSYVLWLIPLAVGNAVSRLVTLEIILKRSHGNHRGMLIGASNSVRSLSGVVAPMVAGFMGQYIGVAYVIYASLFATFVGSILSYQVKKKVDGKKRKED